MASNIASIQQFDRQQAERVFTASFVQAARRYRNQLDENLRSVGCGAAAMETMAAVADSRCALSQVEIAKRMGIEGPTLTRMLALLEHRGWIARTADPRDGRAKKILLTEEGKRALVRLRKIADRVRADLLSEICDHEMEGGIAALHKLLDALSRAR